MSFGAQHSPHVILNIAQRSEESIVPHDQFPPSPLSSRMRGPIPLPSTPVHVSGETSPAIPCSRECGDPSPSRQPPSTFRAKPHPLSRALANAGTHPPPVNPRPRFGAKYSPACHSERSSPRMSFWTYRSGVPNLTSRPRFGRNLTRYPVALANAGTHPPPVNPRPRFGRNLTRYPVLSRMRGPIPLPSTPVHVSGETSPALPCSRECGDPSPSRQPPSTFRAKPHPPSRVLANAGTHPPPVNPRPPRPILPRLRCPRECGDPSSLARPTLPSPHCRKFPVPATIILRKPMHLNKSANFSTPEDDPLARLFSKRISMPRPVILRHELIPNR